MGLLKRFSHAWNAFRSSKNWDTSIGPGSYQRSSFYLPSTIAREASIMATVYNKIALDVANVKMEHVRLNEEGNYLETINSKLNERLNMDANVDQLGKVLIQEAILTMFYEGVVAIVPVDTTLNLRESAFEINELRVGKIMEWYENDVEVEAWNQMTQQRETIVMPKDKTVILENPFYSIMNEPNSTYQRLVHKLRLLDAIDDQSGSGKMDLIIQLPFQARTETKKNQAKERLETIEKQLTGSKYGIAYIDATEHITQLNRPVENNLMNQVQYLTEQFFNQLGVPLSVFNGTADEATMLNYRNSTVYPIISNLCLEMTRKFLTKTARTQRQAVTFFRDAFGLVPVEQMAEIVDKFTRNEILSSNEVRSIIGYKPSNDPRADELRNKNLNDPNAKIKQQEVQNEKEEV